MTYLSLLCTQPTSRFVRLSCLNISKTYLETSPVALLSPLTMVQLWEWSPASRLQRQLQLCLHSIQEKCDTCIKPLVVPVAQLTRTYVVWILAFLPALLLMSGPCPCSSHHLWLLPLTAPLVPWWILSLRLLTLTKIVRTNVCLDCWMSIHSVQILEELRWIRKSLSDRSSQSGEWHAYVHRRIFTIDVIGVILREEVNSGARRSSGKVSQRGEVFEVSWWTSTEI